MNRGSSPIIHLNEIPLNTSDIPRSELDIAAQTRTNPLPWKGQFSPQLIEVLLRTYASAASHVLDPFVGSGTVLGECARRDLAATGVEVNPAAAILARIYSFANEPKRHRALLWESANNALERLASTLESAALGEAPTELRPQAIANLTAADLPSDLVKAALVLSDPTWSSVRPDRLRDSMKKLRELLHILPHTSKPIRVIQGDARRVPLRSGSVDLVLTSPPYINVFNYHQQYRPAVEALGHDVLEAARSEIGSNRKHRMNRFLTVVQYTIDMAAVLSEANRVTRPGGRLIVVIGRESRVRGLQILNGDLLCAVASTVDGVHVEMRQERCFVNRYGERIVEDILHLRTNGSATSRLEHSSARQVGVGVLEQLLPAAQRDVRADVAAAIDAASTVKASPLHDAEVPRR